jgi:hypothetical protein
MVDNYKHKDCWGERRQQLEKSLLTALGKRTILVFKSFFKLTMASSAADIMLAMRSSTAIGMAVEMIKICGW